MTKGFLIKFNFGFGIWVSSHGKIFKMGVSARHPVFVESLWVHLMTKLKNKSVDIISGQLLVNGWDVTWEIIQNVKPWTIKTKARVSHWIKKRVKNRSLGASGLFQWRINELMLEHFRYGRSSEKWKKKGSEKSIII